jgi:hypothetical protein
MENSWSDNINLFIRSVNEHGVKMLMVGGGAVNFHGYQRHSADVDFWIDTSEENLKRLVLVFPNQWVMTSKISFRKLRINSKTFQSSFLPFDFDLELITQFSINKSFDEAYKDAEITEIKGEHRLRWRVLSYDDLIVE